MRESTSSNSLPNTHSKTKDEEPCLVTKRMQLTPPSDPPRDSPFSAILQMKQQSQIRTQISKYNYLLVTTLCAALLRAPVTNVKRKVDSVWHHSRQIRLLHTKGKKETGYLVRQDVLIRTQGTQTLTLNKPYPDSCCSVCFLVIQFPEVWGK